MPPPPSFAARRSPPASVRGQGASGSPPSAPYGRFVKLSSRYLAVFVGGFTLEAAQAVAGAPGVDVFAGVEALAEQSLIRRFDTAAEEPRFGMLETVREYALERLAASDDEDHVRSR